jgi:hypothetical protein
VSVPPKCLLKQAQSLLGHAGVQHAGGVPSGILRSGNVLKIAFTDRMEHSRNYTSNFLK